MAWRKWRPLAALYRPTRSRVDPIRSRAYGIRFVQGVADHSTTRNRDVGGRAIEMAETEYMVRGKGYLRGTSDIENLVLKSDKGTPVLVRDVARVELVPDERRGITELNGEGEVVSRHRHGALRAECVGGDRQHQGQDCRGVRWPARRA